MRNQVGFTALEVMVTLAIVTLLVTLAVPFLDQTIKSNRQTAYFNTLVGALNFARAEAIVRRVTVTVCKSSNGTGCTDEGGWEQGWIVFDDRNGDGARDPANEELLRVTESLPGRMTLTGLDNVADRVTFNSRGFSTATAGTLVICNDRPDPDNDEAIEKTTASARALVVSLYGRMRLDNAPTSFTCPTA